MTTVLVAGSGNITGFNIIRALIGRSDVRVIGCDPSKANASDAWIENFLVPRTTHPDYIDAVDEICRKQGVEFIIPSNDHDVRSLYVGRQRFVDRGVAINAFGKNTLLCLDKVKTSEAFFRSGIQTPSLVFDTDVTRLAQQLPLVFRRASMGGTKKFTHVISDVEELEQVYPRIKDDCVISRFKKGREFTIDVLCDNDSRVLSVVPRERLEVRKAAIHHGILVGDTRLRAECAFVAEKLELVGMNCMQCILSDDDNQNYFFEVNPRPGSGLDITVGGGVNFPSIWLDTQLGKEVTIPEADWGLQMVRYESGYLFK